jgi:hypothetical protein
MRKNGRELSEIIYSKQAGEFYTERKEEKSTRPTQGERWSGNDVVEVPHLPSVTPFEA